MQRHARSANGTAAMTLESVIEDGCAQLKFLTDIRPTPAGEEEPRSQAEEYLLRREKLHTGECQEFEIEIDLTPDMSFRDAENAGCAVLRRRLSALRQCATKLLQMDPGEESESDDGEAALKLQRISSDEGDMDMKADFVANLGLPDDWVPASERSDREAHDRFRYSLDTHKFLIKVPAASDVPYESMRNTACGLLVEDVDALLDCMEVLTN